MRIVCGDWQATVSSEQEAATPDLAQLECRQSGVLVKVGGLETSKNGFSDAPDWEIATRSRDGIFTKE